MDNQPINVGGLFLKLDVEGADEVSNENNFNYSFNSRFDYSYFKMVFILLCNKRITLLFRNGTFRYAR